MAYCNNWTITTTGNTAIEVDSFANRSSNNWTITTTGNTPPGSFHWYDGSFGSFDLNIKKCPCGCQCASSKNSSFQLEIGIVKIVYKKCPNENGMFHKEIESFEIDGKIFK